MGLILGISLIFNALFIGLYMYGKSLEKKEKRFYKNVANKKTQQQLTKLYYDYGRFYYE